MENVGTIVLRSVPPSVCQFPSHKMCGTVLKKLIMLSLWNLYSCTSIVWGLCISFFFSIFDINFLTGGHFFYVFTKCVVHSSEKTINATPIKLVQFYQQSMEIMHIFFFLNFRRNVFDWRPFSGFQFPSNKMCCTQFWKNY